MLLFVSCLILLFVSVVFVLCCLRVLLLFVVRGASLVRGIVEAFDRLDGEGRVAASGVEPCTRMYVYIYNTFIGILTWRERYVCMYVCMVACLYVCLHVCIFVCLYLCMFVS